MIERIFKSEGIGYSYGDFERFLDSLDLGEREMFCWGINHSKIYHLTNLGLTLNVKLGDGKFYLGVSGYNNSFFLKKFEEAQEGKLKEKGLEKLALANS